MAKRFFQGRFRGTLVPPGFGRSLPASLVHSSKLDQSGQRDAHHGPGRVRLEFDARVRRHGFVRPAGLYARRLVYHGHSPYQVRGSFCRGGADGPGDGGGSRDRCGVVLRAPQRGLFRPADPRLRPDYLDGHLRMVRLYRRGQRDEVRFPFPISFFPSPVPIISAW